MRLELSIGMRTAATVVPLLRGLARRVCLEVTGHERRNGARREFSRIVDLRARRGSVTIEVFGRDLFGDGRLGFEHTYR